MWLIYGPEGVGKSSLAADADSPILLDIEGGADHIDVARYSFRDGARGHVPHTFAEVQAALDDLAANDHVFKTVIVDTIDALEALIFTHICKTADKPKNSIEDFGYGKGYVMAIDEWRQVLAKLERIRAKGITVIMLGHSVIKPFKNPLGEDYDRYQLRMHDKAASLLKERSEVVGFLRFNEGAAHLPGDDSRGARPRGFSNNQRVLHFMRNAAWDAKSRLPLPDRITVGAQHPWQEIAATLADERAQTDDDLRAVIAEELARLGEVVTLPSGLEVAAAQIASDCAKADRSVLHRTVAMLKAIEIEETPTQAHE